MFNKSKHNEYLVLIYRFIALLVFYSVLRLLFFAFNASYFPNVDFTRLMTMMRGGLKFDISILIYLNLVYLIVYAIPLPASWKFSKGYRISLKTIFLFFNTLGIAANCTDIIYFRFIHRRTTYSILNGIKDEDNMLRLWGQFLIDYWYVFILFIALIYLLYKAYSLLEEKPTQPSKGGLYYLKGTLILGLIGGLSIVGMRGGYRHSTRPINMANAGKYVESPEEIAIVINTPFSILRNWGKSTYTAYNYYDASQLEKIYSPVHQGTKPNTKKNVVVFILESWNREYIGSLNKTLDNGQYKGYTPFLDSLIEHSLVCTNAYANGQKSIDAMPSIIASIPSLVLPYISSEYSSNHINSLASILKKEGYHSCFFHGAQNGSMGFESFAKVAGFDEYYGRKEYNNDKDYDGIWGIWDEPYLTYFAEELSQIKAPFYTSLFTLSSHHPFKVPKQYEDVYPKGTLPIHQCMGYTDNALRQFFNVARTKEWYNNTLFVFTADHSSRSYFEENKTTQHRFSIPILFYAPGDTTLVGKDNALAQQIDIMPTVLDYVGTQQSYIAFGQSILQHKKDRFVINYTNDTYQIIYDDYILYFNGKQILSAFNYVNDPMLRHKINEAELPDDMFTLAKAVVQQYNNRIINNTLTIK